MSLGSLIRVAFVVTALGLVGLANPPKGEALPACWGGCAPITTCAAAETWCAGKGCEWSNDACSEFGTCSGAGGGRLVTCWEDAT